MAARLMTSSGAIRSPSGKGVFTKTAHDVFYVDDCVIHELTNGDGKPAKACPAKMAPLRMLGKLEIAVMEVVWAGGDLSVHDVAQRLARPLAYTTVMTTLDRLYKKSLLTRRKIDRAFRYAPALTRTEWERERAGEWFSALLAESTPAGDLLISCFVDMLGDQDAALLDALARQINLKRKLLKEAGTK